MRVTPDSILIQENDVPAAAIDGQIVLLSIPAGAYLGFNGVASDIWRMLSAPCSVSAIFDALSYSHEVDAATLSRDVLPFLQDLIDRRLARHVAPDTPL